MNAGIEAGEWPSKKLPSSWCWFAFGQFWIDYTDSHRKVPQKNYLSEGKLAVVDQGEIQIGGYTNNLSMQSSVPLPAIVFGDHTRAVKYIDQPFAQGADGVRVLAPAHGVDPAFGYHALRCVRLPDKGYSRHFKFLKATSFPVAPPSEQRRIVAKIDSLASKSRRAREHLDHMPRLAEKYKQVVLAAAFRGELSDSAGRVPPFLSSVVALRTGPFGSALHKSDYVKGGIPIVNPMHIANGRIVQSSDMSVTKEKAKDLSEFQLVEGDVVLARRGVMGRCAVVTSRQAGFLCGTGSMIVRPEQDRLLPHFLQRYLSSPDVIDALEEGAVGTTMVNLNQSILLRQRIPLPTLSEQTEIVRRIDSAFAWIDRLTAEATGARNLINRLDQAVLAKAFRGELVPPDPKDEPASLLLDRVRAERQGSDDGPSRRHRKSS
jgi:type I restriction enzyme S subunit